MLFQATIINAHKPGALAHERADDASSQDGSSDITAKSPPSKYSPPGSGSIFAGTHATPVASNVQSPRISSALAMGPVLPGSTSVHGSPENSGAPSSPSSVKLPSPSKEHNMNFSTRKPPSTSDSGITKEIGSMTSGTPGAIPASPDMAKKNTSVSDDRFGSSGMIQPLITPSSSKTLLPHSANVSDATTVVDSVIAGENTAIESRVVSPLAVTGTQWKPGSPFTQNEMVCASRSFTFLSSVEE